jgi:hypothetical protein
VSKEFATAHQIRGAEGQLRDLVDVGSERVGRPT